MKLMRRDKRGQLMIIEVLVSVSLLVIMAFSIYTITGEVKDEPATDVLRRTAFEALIASDEAEVLRPAVWNPTDPTSTDPLDQFLDSYLPTSLQWRLQRTNNTLSLDWVGAHSAAIQPSPDVEIEVISYILTGYGTSGSYYELYLEVWSVI
ncbi:MAG: hypothetical protein ACFFCQ_00425 [Promethearchaeota archaeon]